MLRLFFVKLIFADRIQLMIRAIALLSLFRQSDCGFLKVTRIITNPPGHRRPGILKMYMTPIPTLTIPQNYREWHQCITVACGIKLDIEFIESRIKILENKNHSYTETFIQLYGKQHYENVVSWFYMAKQREKR